MDKSDTDQDTTLRLSSVIGRGIVFSAIFGLLLLVALFVLIYLFRFQLDCAPHEIDGQCGMGLFFGKVFAVAISTGFAVVMGVFFGSRYWRRNTQPLSGR